MCLRPPAWLWLGLFWVMMGCKHQRPMDSGERPTVVKCYLGGPHSFCDKVLRSKTWGLIGTSSLSPGLEFFGSLQLPPICYPFLQPYHQGIWTKPYGPIRVFALEKENCCPELELCWFCCPLVFGWEMARTALSASEANKLQFVE